MRRSNTSDVHRQGCLGFCVSQIVSQNKFEQAAQIALDEKHTHELHALLLHK